MDEKKRFFERTPWSIALVFTVSVLATCLFWIALPDHLRVNENTDYINFYEPVARNILAGNGLIGEDGAPAIRYAPGYPIILAAIFRLSDLLNIPEAGVLSAFSLICMGLTSVLIFSLARTVWGPLPALVSALAWITCPFVLWLTKQPNSELPFLVVFYGGLCLLWYALIRKDRAWYTYFICGALVGFAMLIRPMAIGVGGVISLILWLMARQISRGLRMLLVAALLLGNLVVIIPWEAWVYFRTDRIVLLSTAGLPAIRDGLTFAVARKNRYNRVKVPRDVAAFMDEAYHAYNYKGELNSLREAGSFIAAKLRSRPLTMMKLYAIKALRSWYGTESHRFETRILLLQIPYIIMILLGSITAWKRGGVFRQLTIVIWLIVLYFWGMTILALSILRYMVPALGLLFILIPGAFRGFSAQYRHE